MRTISLALLSVAFLLFLNFTDYLDGRDTCVFRTGALLVGPNLYNSDLQRGMQPEQEHMTPFYRAPFYAALLRPLIYLHFDLAWLLVRLAAALGFIYLLHRLIGSAPWWIPWLAMLFFPLQRSFEIHQDGVLMLCALAGVLLLERNGQHVAAGLLLSLTLQKPTSLLLLPVVILAQRRWRMLGGFVAGGSALAALSLWIVGLGAFSDYRTLYTAYPHPFFAMPTARGIATDLEFPALAVLLTMLGIAAVVVASRRSDFITAFCIGIVGSVFIGPHNLQHDLALLALPVIYFVAKGSREMRWSSVALMFPPVFYLYRLPPPYTALHGLTILAYLMALTWGYLNMRTPAAEPASSLPRRNSSHSKVPPMTQPQLIPE